jgi:arabinosyltransferase C
VAIALALLALFPTLLALLTSPPAFTLGHQLNVDDHMVYAAWMKQAAEGKFLFNNRFATEPQPGLTIHLYFLVLGWISVVIGQLWTTTLARVGFSILFVWMLAKFLSRFDLSPLAIRLGIIIATTGAGFGYLYWQPFGKEFVNKTSFGASLFGGWIPIDVWQPEAFVFPSMLTNSLFMVSLCLILFVLKSVVDAQKSWLAVLPGAGAMFLLMNIHSYDVLLLSLILVGFLAASLVSKQATGAWVTRAICIGLGAIPSAAWFLFVLSRDPVFRERAETLTFSPTFQQLFGGILPLAILAGFAFFSGLPRLDEDPKTRQRMLVGGGGALLLILSLFFGSSGADPGKYFLSASAFVGVLLLACGSVALMAKKDLLWNLLWAWAMIGLVAPYFPGLFQRKLAMALAIPWAILAAIGLASLIQQRVKTSQHLAASVAAILLGLTSIFWLQREILLIRNNVSSTTVHAITYSQEVRQLLDRLDQEPGRVVVLAPPGVPQPQEGNLGFTTPLVPDLNPVISGLVGAYTYAGHWSETPNYNRKRNEVSQFFLGSDGRGDGELLRKSRATHIVGWVPGLGLRDHSNLGEVIYQGQQWVLIRIRR